MTTSDLKSFHYLENGEISFSIFDTVITQKQLTPGFYKVSYLGYPSNRVLLKQDTNYEAIKIHNFPDKEKIDALFKSFFEDKIVNKMKVLGFFHKTGILLHGKEGTGKSTIIKYYCNKLISEQNAIVFQLLENGDYLTECWDFVMNVRRIQKSPIAVIFEEIDGIIRNRKEGYLKTLLDGNMSIDNCIYFGTTNYINEIPEAIKNRPSRFKYCLNIEGIQTKEDVENIISSMLSELFNEKEIEKFTHDLTGQTLDTIKQFCIDKIMDLETYNKKTKQIGFFASR